MAKSVSLLVGVFLLLYIVPLGVRPLIAPDETRYAEISREMLASGDWIVPHLNGLRYFEKPVLGYWLNAVAIRALGENEFAVRLPSALAAGLAALLLGLWARRYAADRMAGLLTVGVFLLSFEVFAIGVFCVLDSLFSLFVTASILFFYFAHESGKRLMLVAAGVSCGLAFLTKGPLGVVIPALVLVPFTLWEGRFKATLRIIWIPCVAAVLVALPWSVMIYRREPDFWHYFLWVEHVDRFLRPEQGQHAEPMWYYLPIVVVGVMPWTPLAATIVQGLRRTGLKDPMIRLAICWLVLPFLFFSLSSGKLGTYILVCFPALAFLIAVGLLQCLGQSDTKGFIVGTGVLAAGTGLLLCILVLSFFVPLRGVSVLRPTPPWLLAAAGLLTWCALAMAAIVRKTIRRRLALYWLAPVLFLFSWHFVVGAAAPQDKMPGAFLRSNRDCGADASCTLVCDDGLAASACWFYKRSDVFLMDGQGEYEYGLGYRDAKHRFLKVPEFKNLIAHSSDKRCVALITTTGHLRSLEPRLPRPTARIAVDNLVFARFTPGAASSE
jgi:4-amino-4-deoxy-L-arabinose transferase